MKLVCLNRSSFILLALILRQLGLSVFRSGPNTENVYLFLKKNYGCYNLLKEKLSHTINKYDLEINWRGEIEKKRPTGMVNLFISKSCFYESDFNHIIKIYLSGCEIIESGKIEQNDRWIILGHEAMILSNDLIDFKLSKRERKIVNLVEHFAQNEMVHDKYYTIEEALSILDLSI
ncbi:hypothetical protein LX77_00846 [Gelidibacter algens]|uniref:Uncharacterized protein n=1 Tax=Gelidibacter algens TaxID=49280 RepID=A0A1A7R527_9FLAO|nr:hypothetical protein [Gelidibacter algens]OBX26574.1 hypothetical protein A9996_04590 [Gelidibacter algens]RAJ26592.1 hypothetical protein LX77_00846 [Gelidibacter algens]